MIPWCFAWPLIVSEFWLEVLRPYHFPDATKKVHQAEILPFFCPEHKEAVKPRPQRIRRPS